MKKLRWIFCWTAPAVLLAGLAENTAAGQAGATSDAVPSKAANASLADAKALAAKGRLDQALAELDGLAKAEPEEAGVERLRGMIFYQKDQLAEAETAFARAVSQDAQDRESTEM